MAITTDNEARFKTVKSNLPFEILYSYLREDYGFPPAVCRSLSEDFQDLTNLYYGGERDPGEIIYNAASSDVPAGTALVDMKKVPVRLTVFSADDAHTISTYGPEELTRRRIVRLIYDAYDQGGALTQADIALILGISPKTVIRKMKDLQSDGTVLPTRGNLKDIGPSVSHKSKIIEMYLSGCDYLEIKRKTKHSDEAITRYLKTFSRFVVLTDEDFGEVAMQMLTGHSSKLLNEYSSLYERFSLPEYERRMEHVRSLGVKKNVKDEELKQGGIQQ